MIDYAPEPEGTSPRRKALNRFVLRTTLNSLYWYTKHWLFLINAIMGVIVLMAFMSPLLMAMGLYLPASVIYTMFSPFCHQMPNRSFFVSSYQLCVCQRCIAIYLVSALAGLAFVTLRGRIKPLPWWLFALFIAPMVLDGFSQLFGLRESTWELRVITGSLFGLGSVWLTFPMIEQACRRTRFLLERQPW